MALAFPAELGILFSGKALGRCERWDPRNVMFGQRLPGRFAHPKRDLISWNGLRRFSTLSAEDAFLWKSTV
jgi:hypothetical protein